MFLIGQCDSPILVTSFELLEKPNLSELAIDRRNPKRSATIIRLRTFANLHRTYCVNCPMYQRSPCYSDPFLLAALACVCQLATTVIADSGPRPNVLIAISDDQSWPHASAYGSQMVHTPAFDQIARQGVLFNQAFCASPGCSPSRAALLTGLNTWQLEHAGTHGSYFAPKFVTFPERLENSGYFVGFTGKGWAPGNFKELGRTRNPAGTDYTQGRKSKTGDAKHVAAFGRFLADCPKGKPFCFWFGSHDPHRAYVPRSGLGKGKTLDQAETPPFLPNDDAVRSDLLDYAFEVERFDDHLGQMLAMLKERGDFENTLIIVTSDNGMPFPRAKANCYEHGIHMPLAIRSPNTTAPNRKVDDLVGFTDLTATIYDLTGVAPPEAMEMVGKSIRNLLESKQSGIIDPSREAIFAARERHSSSRFNTLGYPQRAIRTHQHLLIRNFRPERWPAGASQKFASATFDENGELLESQLSPEGAFHDIDGSPTLSFLNTNEDRGPDKKRFLELATARRPEVELFDIRKDPGCLHNLANEPQHAEVRDRLTIKLMDYLADTGDPRATTDGDVWETYPRTGSMRWFPQPDWLKDKSAPKQDWLEQRRPRK